MTRHSDLHIQIDVLLMDCKMPEVRLLAVFAAGLAVVLRKIEFVLIFCYSSHIIEVFLRQI